MSNTNTYPVKGYNYSARRTANDTSADVLHVGNGFVVYRVCDVSGPTKKLRVASLAGFRRAYSGECPENLYGAKTGKAVILRTLPEAQVAWQGA